MDSVSARPADARNTAALPALRHRLILNFEGEAEAVKSDEIIAEVLERVPREAVRVS